MFRRVLFPGFLLVSLASAIAAPPAWWASRGATDANPPNDDAAVNQGQLKQFTQKAVQELNTRIPGGAGTDLNGLVNGWMQAYQTGGYNAANPLPADFDAMNSGQLKWIANKVHARLVLAKYENAPPAWLVPNPATDKQLVNLGQLKTVFNFDLTAPTGQLPEWWQKFYFNGQTGIDPAADPDGDSLTNIQEISMGTDPNTIGNDADNNSLPDDWELANAEAFAVYPPILASKMSRNQSSPASLLLRNDTSSAVDYSVAITGTTFPAYSHEDSLAGNISYTWEDISSTGTRLPDVSNGDDNYEEAPFTDFAFPFYGGNFYTVFVSSNGLLAFGSGNWSYHNRFLPGTSAPSNIIAPFWDDLDTRTGGDIYYKQKTDRFIVQFQNVTRFSSTDTLTFQVVLFSDGRIQFRYQTLNGVLDSCTVGIQNVTRDAGIGIAYNTLYLQNQMAIEIRPQSDFFTINPLSGSIPAHSIQSLSGLFQSWSLAPSVYHAHLTLTHDGLAANPIVIPVQLEILNLPSTVALISPIAGQSILQGTATSISANASDPEGIARIEFYDGTLKIGETTGDDSNYSIYNYQTVPGLHSFIARAVDSFGSPTDSLPVTLSVIPDTDGDGMPDAWEIANGLAPGDFTDAEIDADGDGYSNLEEYQFQKNPNVAEDSDGDGMPDGWEYHNGLDLSVDDSAGDLDRDGLSNFDEYGLETRANNPDTDGDGMWDYFEFFYGFNTVVNDGAHEQDPDNDGYSNLEESQAETDPFSSDSYLIRVVYSRPVNGETVVPCGKVVIIGLDRPLAPGITVIPNFVISDFSDQPVDGTVKILSDRKTITFVSSTPFAPNAKYRIVLRRSTSGLPVILHTAVFTTSGEVANDGPFLMTTSPADGNINVATNIAVSSYWSEPLDESSLSASSLSILDASGVAVPFTMNYDSFWHRLDLIPTNNLDVGAEYFVAVNSGITNLRGQSMASGSTLRFKTIEEPLTTPEIGPYVTEVSPSQLAKNISTNAIIQVSWSESMNAGSLNPTTCKLIKAWNGEEIPITLSYSGAFARLTVTPQAVLDENTAYTVHFTSGVQNATGLGFTQHGEWEAYFRTGIEEPGGGGPATPDPGWENPGPGGPGLGFPPINQ